MYCSLGRSPSKKNFPEAPHPFLHALSFPLYPFHFIGQLNLSEDQVPPGFGEEEGLDDPAHLSIRDVAGKGAAPDHAVTYPSGASMLPVILVAAVAGLSPHRKPSVATPDKALQRRYPRPGCVQEASQETAISARPIIPWAEKKLNRVGPGISIMSQTDRLPPLHHVFPIEQTWDVASANQDSVQ